jgi:peptidyl-Lys metalloendopeptidase
MRYQAWFGSYAAQRYDTVASSFARICHILANHEISFDCRGESNTCTDAGAYTSADSPDTISLCEGYWLLPPDGTRSQASIIIHEVSHFADVADTDDYAYWYNDCRNLASIDPDKAVKNADSYEYYAVNMPRR